VYGFTVRGATMLDWYLGEHERELSRADRARVCCKPNPRTETPAEHGPAEPEGRRGAAARPRTLLEVQLAAHPGEVERQAVP
jgi:hypothetical protein